MSPRDVRSVSAVIVTYNSEDHIDALLDSVPQAAGSLRVDIIVVDNASTDETWARLKQRHEIRAVWAGDNLGFAGGINVARRHLDGTQQAVAILNPDLVLRPRALEALAAGLSVPDVGIVAPRIVDSTGTLFHSLRREPAILGALGEALFGSRWPVRPVSLTDTLRDADAYEQPCSVDWASGACLMIAADCDAAVGAWDESFFLYSEETDYARRARARGFRVRYVPEALVEHVGAGSGSSPALVALMAVNRIRDFERHHGTLASSAFRAIVAGHHLLRSNRMEERAALRAVLQRSTWGSLPGGDIHRVEG